MQRLQEIHKNTNNFIFYFYFSTCNNLIVILHEGKTSLISRGVSLQASDPFLLSLSVKMRNIYEMYNHKNNCIDLSTLDNFRKILINQIIIFKTFNSSRAY